MAATGTVADGEQPLRFKESSGCRWLRGARPAGIRAEMELASAASLAHRMCALFSLLLFREERAALLAHHVHRVYHALPERAPACPHR